MQATVADEASIAAFELEAAARVGATTDELLPPFETDSAVYIREAGRIRFRARPAGAIRHCPPAAQETQ